MIIIVLGWEIALAKIITSMLYKIECFLNKKEEIPK